MTHTQKKKELENQKDEIKIMWSKLESDTQRRRRREERVSRAGEESAWRGT